MTSRFVNILLLLDHPYQRVYVYGWVYVAVLRLLTGLRLVLNLFRSVRRCVFTLQRPLQDQQQPPQELIGHRRSCSMLALSILQLTV